METVLSQDGTPVAFHRLGDGPPLVLVHGMAAANPLAWTGAIPGLAARFTVYAFDRRGHGSSGDRPAYSLEREAEDAAAVCRAAVSYMTAEGGAAGEPACLLGHSFGGLVALDAALLLSNLRALVLYEPAVPLPGEPVYPPGLVDRLQAMLDAGDEEGLLVAFYREVAGMSPDEIEGLRASPAWGQRLAAARSIPREARAEESYIFDPARFDGLRVPTLLLRGGESPGSLARTSALLREALPNCREVVLPGQGHIAMYTAPDLFLREVVGFLEDAESNNSEGG